MDLLVYIVRHGQTDWNVEQRLQGQAEVDMNEVGRAQVSRNASLLVQLIKNPSDFDFVSSPLRRTRETMVRIRSQFGLLAEDYATDPRLMELHFGDWQGFTYAELEQQQLGSTQERRKQKWTFMPPGLHAESYEILAARAGQWFSEMNRPTVCTTHGGIIRTLFHLIGNVPPEEAAELPVPQDRVLRVMNGKLEWL